MDSNSWPHAFCVRLICHGFHDLIHYNSASLDSEVTCGNFQMIFRFLYCSKSSNNISQGLTGASTECQKLPVWVPNRPYGSRRSVRSMRNNKAGYSLVSTTLVMLLPYDKWNSYGKKETWGGTKRRGGGSKEQRKSSVCQVVTSDHLSSMWNLAFLSLLLFKMACKSWESHWLQLRSNGTVKERKPQESFSDDTVVCVHLTLNKSFAIFNSRTRQLVSLTYKLLANSW